MRELGVDEYYHVYNRGALKREIFLDDRDRIRFILLMLYLQSDLALPNLHRHVSYFVQHRRLNIEDQTVENIVKQRNVSLLAYTLMPNHFHLILENVKENGISKYMQRLPNAYTKYFNTKYEQNGHLFQGPYKSVHIEGNDQLLYLSAYIHKHSSSWSSREDYLRKNRWGKLLSPDLILGQFGNQIDYVEWLKESIAKEPEYLKE